MIKVLALVEGPTEEAFVTTVVDPYFLPRGIHLQPVILATKRLASGKKFKGGVSVWARIRDDLRRLLGDTSADCVTTVLDYYGFPTDAPGMSELPVGDAYARVRYLEGRLAESIADPRFRPYLSLHEFEALVLAAVYIASEVPGLIDQEVFPPLASLGAFPEPELVDEDDPPSRRITAASPSYDKVAYGPLITRQVPMSYLINACPHFASWIADLEELSSA